MAKQSSTTKTETAASVPATKKSTGGVSNAEKSVSVINDNVVLAMTAGLIPWPGADLAAITAIQVKLVSNLSDVYGVKFEKERATSFIAALLGSSAAVVLGRGVLGSFLKGIPIVGTIAGMLAVPVTAGAATYAIGRLFVQHYESGGTFLTFKPEKVQEHYDAFFKEGQKIAADLKQSI